MNKCGINDEDFRAHFTHFKNASDRKGNNQFRGKPYNAQDDKGKQRAIDDKKNQVREGLPLLSSVLSVVSRATVLISERIMFSRTLSMVGQVTIL